MFLFFVWGARALRGGGRAPTYREIKNAPPRAHGGVGRAVKRDGGQRRRRPAVHAIFPVHEVFGEDAAPVRDEPRSGGGLVQVGCGECAVSATQLARVVVLK